MFGFLLLKRSRLTELSVFKIFGSLRSIGFFVLVRTITSASFLLDSLDFDFLVPKKIIDANITYIFIFVQYDYI